MNHNTNILTIIFIASILLGCTHDSSLKFHHNINELQGVWRDTIWDHNEVFVEDLVIHGDSLEYLLSNASTHIVYDKLNGIINFGNEEKMSWICISPFTHTSRQISWDILDLSNYQMKLYSNLSGEHNYRRVYATSIEGNTIQDTLSEILQYFKYLPLHKDDLIKKFGSNNRLTSKTDIEYLSNNDLFWKIAFCENDFNDSIYSYSLSINNRNSFESLLPQIITQFHSIKGSAEYIDTEVLTPSSKIIKADSLLSKITIIPVKDYDSWPDVSHFLGKPFSIAEEEYGKQYIYDYNYKELNGIGMSQYYFQTSKDSIFNYVMFQKNSTGIIDACEISLFKYFTNEEQAFNECSKIAALLNLRYYIKEWNVDQGIYLFESGKTVTKSEYTIKLFVQYYGFGMGLYRIHLLYNK